MVKYHVMGSMHIDLAWKKGEDEMAELLEAFVVRVLDMLDHVPGFRYMLEQAYHYRGLGKRRPDLIERLRAHVMDGRLEFVGGMASTLETNFPHGESLIRNHLLGRKWVRENLGTEPTTGWFIDTFGLHAQLPQLMNQFGIPRLMANRFGGTRLHDAFLAKGLDGSTVRVVGRDAHGVFVRSPRVFFGMFGDWKGADGLVAEASSTDAEGPLLVVPYVENEYQLSARTLYHIREGNRAVGGEAWGFSTPSGYLDALESSGYAWPVEDADLNPEFTGTFAQRIGIRLVNRRMETLLLEAEKWAVLKGLKGFREELDEAWWMMAFNHFHDVFTGSHPTGVYGDVMAKYDGVRGIGGRIMDKALMPAACSAIGGFRVYNGLPWARREAVAFDLPESMVTVGSVVGPEGPVPFSLEDGRVSVIANLPPCGYVDYSLASGGDAHSNKHVQQSVMENASLRLGVHADGTISLLHKESGRLVLDGVGDLLVAQQESGSFQIEGIAGPELPSIAGSIRVEGLSDHGIAQELTVSGGFPRLPWAGPGNTLEWRIVFRMVGDSPVLGMDLRLVWKGEATRIRLKVPTTIDTSKGFYEIPFGTVERKPYGVRANAKGEWPAQRFVAIEDHRSGLALINTGAAGVETAGGTMWTTILRAPRSEYAGMVPDDTSSQHGVHDYSFALVPYSGGWAAADIPRLALGFNTPPICVPMTETGSPGSESLMELGPSNIVLSCVKAPEDGSGDLIVRFYEACGNACMARLTVKGLRAAWLTDLLEEGMEPLGCNDGDIEVEMGPYQIRTVRVMR